MYARTLPEKDTKTNPVITDELSGPSRLYTNWNSTNRSTNSYKALTFFNNVCHQGEKNTEKKLARRQLTVKEESSKGPTI